MNAASLLCELWLRIYHGEWARPYWEAASLRCRAPHGEQGPCETVQGLRAELAQEQQVCGTAQEHIFCTQRKTSHVNETSAHDPSTSKQVGLMGSDAMPARDDLEPRSTRGRQLRRHRTGQGVEKRVPQATAANCFPQQAKPDSHNRPTDTTKGWGGRSTLPLGIKALVGSQAWKLRWPLQARCKCLLSLQKPGPYAHSHWA